MFNYDELKTIRTEFESELKSDKLYQPMLRSIKSLINHIPHDLKEITQRDSIQKSHVSSCHEY